VKKMAAEKGTPAEVVEVIKRTGVYGEIIQVLCRILDGPEKGRIKRRNVRGNIKKGDMIVLLSTEREAKEISAKK
jgi:small subunit ribosomal protein S28e